MNSSREELRAAVDRWRSSQKSRPPAMATHKLIARVQRGETITRDVVLTELPSGFPTDAADELTGLLQSFHIQATPMGPGPSAPESPEPSTSGVGPEEAVDVETWKQRFVPTDVVSAATRTAHELQVRLRGDDLELTWPAAESDQPVLLYRLVSRPGARSFLPEEAALVAVTRDTRHLDRRTPTTQATNFQVWCHAGADAEAAALTQPVLVAESWVIAPPMSVAVQQDGIDVVGHWRELLEGSVEVFRVPSSEAYNPARLTDPEFRIGGERTNHAGFADHAVDPGAYVYVFRVRAEADGTVQYSPVVVRSMTVVSPIEPVQDLNIAARKDASGRTVLDLMWTSPGSDRVEIYRSQDEPEAGIDQQVQDPQSLLRLRVGELIPTPITNRLPDGRVVMENTPWPEGWARIYLTPVTVRDDQILPGPTQVLIDRGAPITSAAIHQRVHHQEIVLAWPMRSREPGQEPSDDDYIAAAVQVFLMRRGGDAEAAIQGTPHVTVSLTQYKRQGTVDVALPPEGCDVVLVPITHQDGRQIQGKPLTLAYAGLDTLQYRVVSKHIPLMSTRTVAVKLRAPQEMTEVPPLKLVYRADRLPLDYEDGELVALAVKDDETLSKGGHITTARVGTDWTEDVWVGKAPARGYLRLFAVAPAERLAHLAVLDPSLSTLRAR